MDQITSLCLHCNGPLKPGLTRWRCLACPSTFRALQGIPDLRTHDDEYLPNADDWSVALKLDAAFDTLDFPDLLNLYFDLSPEIDPSSRRKQIIHIRSATGRTALWLDQLKPLTNGRLLDLGCGSGSFLSAVGPEFPRLAGVDIAMRWLLVARKRLDQENLSHIPLLCACAEALPFADKTFTGLVAGDVIEHVGNQRQTLAEAFRVLQPGARIFLASPNRFSLAPEPHVHLWGVGFLPRSLMPTYVRLTRGVDFRAIHTLGFREWRRLLRSSPFQTGTLTVPPLPPSDLAHFGLLKRKAAQLYNALVALPLAQPLARAFGPLFHVTAQRPPDPPKPLSKPHSSIPATRPRSMPSITPRSAVDSQ